MEYLRLYLDCDSNLLGCIVRSLDHFLSYLLPDRSIAMIYVRILYKISDDKRIIKIIILLICDSRLTASTRIYLSR